MQKYSSAIIFLVAIAAIAAYNSLFVVPEGKQAVVKQFGRIISVKPDAGLKVKLPFLQQVVLLEKRILNWDGIPNEIPTRDKKYIIVDTTARWRISDARTFIEAVQNENTAMERISRIIDGATRDTVSAHNRIETIRNTNAILDEIARISEQREAILAGGENLDMAELAEEQITGEIEKVEEGRERLSRMIIERAEAGLRGLGIELIDVQLRRVSSEESEEAQVYERMITERQQIAQKIRSIGAGEQAKIRGETDRLLKEIESNAYRQVQAIQGRADADSIRIYADAVRGDEDLYEFLRTLEMYKAGLRRDSNFILSSESDFFKILREGSNSGR